VSSVTGQGSFNASGEAASYIGLMLRELVLLAKHENVRAVVPDLQRAIETLGPSEGDR